MSTGIQNGFFGWVMRVGNKLPNPFFLFVTLMLITLGLSSILSYYGVTVQADIIDKSTNKLVNQVVAVRNLLSIDYLHYILKDFTKVYINFAPLGLVMVTLLVVGYVKETGFFVDLMHQVCNVVPKSFVTFSIVLMACMANLASNAGIIISTTVASAIFLTMKRNPIVGAAIGYAAAHGAEPCNIMITGFMVMMSSITQMATDAAGIPATVTPLSNYYFLLVALVILATTITIVTEKFIPKIVPLELTDTEWKRMLSCSTKKDSSMDRHLIDIAEGNVNSSVSKKALLLTAIAVLGYMTILFLGMTSYGGFLLNPQGKLVPKSPFTDGIIAIIVGLFFLIGTVYGTATKKIKRCNDIPKMMQSGIYDAAGYLVICLPAAFAIKFFGDSHLTTIVSVKGAELLITLGVSKYPAMIGLIVVIAFINLFITSGSAKWMIFAPIVVPMFYRLGIPPEWTQLAYVIGDKCTDSVSIINYYIPVVLMIWDKYRRDDEEIGIGNVYALTLPISITVTVCFLMQFTLWWIFKLPLGL